MDSAVSGCPFRDVDLVKSKAETYSLPQRSSTLLYLICILFVSFFFTDDTSTARLAAAITVEPTGRGDVDRVSSAPGPRNAATRLPFVQKPRDSRHSSLFLPVPCSRHDRTNLCKGAG